MTQQQAESVKDLAKDTVEALGVIMERECPKCEGIGQTAICPGHTPSEVKRGIASGSRVPIRHTCGKCDGTGKLSWKWEPMVGEWAVHEKTGKVDIYLEDQYGHPYWGIGQETRFGESVATANPMCFYGIDHLIPILHWEEIERVLEGVGHYLRETNCLPNYGFYLTPKGSDIFDEATLCKGKSRQEAVMRAVIKLGEELNEDK